MIQYHDILKRILSEGTPCDDRTGVGTISVFGHQSRYFLSNQAPGAREAFIKDGTQAGFPAITTKKLHLRSIFHELLWFLKGDTNIAYLKDNNVRIWDEWADDNGDLGPVYGSQWRSWTSPDGSTIDQITQLIENIKTNPNSRRHIVTAWNPAEIDQMALPACHCLFQFNVQRATDGGRDFLNCQLYQRSADLFLGVPFNIASYALLTMMIAQVTNYRPGSFIHTLADAHIYINHLHQVDEQLSRECKPLPTMKLNPNIKNIFDFTIEDFELTNYEPHPHIKATVAV